MATNETARSAAFASQSDKSRVLAAGYVDQMIALSRAVRDLRDGTVQAIGSMQIPHRWNDTRLELLVDGQWVAGPDLAGKDGLSIASVALVDGDLILTFENGGVANVGSVIGPRGLAATLEVASTETLADGEDAYVVNSGTDEAAQLVFGIPRGIRGETGFSWVPVTALISDGERRVRQITDWIGGTGTKPATGQYEGATGWTAVLAEAVDLRGSSGTGSGDMMASVFDPTNKNADAFSMANMAEGTTAKILTATERAEIGALRTDLAALAADLDGGTFS